MRLRNAPRKRSCMRFVKNQGWWDTVVNNYSNERFKYTFHIRGGSRTGVTSKMKHFMIIVNGWKSLTIITKCSILYVAPVLDPLLHMSRNTFNHISKNIRGGLQKQIVTELPISAEMRLAICLYTLTRGDYHYTIGEMAGISQSTVYRIVIEVSELITEMLWEEHV